MSASTEADANSNDEARLEVALTADMLRITFPYLAFISMVALAGSVLNSFRQFGLAAFTPVLHNVAVIFAMVGIGREHEPVALRRERGRHPLRGVRPDRRLRRRATSKDRILSVWPLQAAHRRARGSTHMCQARACRARRSRTAAG